MCLPQDPKRRRKAAVHRGSREAAERAQEAASALQGNRINRRTTRGHDESRAHN